MKDREEIINHILSTIDMENIKCEVKIAITEVIDFIEGKVNDIRDLCDITDIDEIPNIKHAYAEADRLSDILY